MKADGTYLQPVTYRVTMVENPNYDNKNYANSLESAKIEFLDFTQN